MKQFILILSILFLTIPAKASFYIVNQDDRVVAKAEYVPSEADLSTRNEISVYSKDDIPLEKAEYRGGKIVEHKETTAEKAEKVKVAEATAESNLIEKRMRRMACEKLVEEGQTLKTKCEDLEK